MEAAASEAADPLDSLVPFSTSPSSLRRGEGSSSVFSAFEGSPGLLTPIGLGGGGKYLVQ